jgi:heterodisulfide reductase subunit A
MEISEDVKKLGRQMGIELDEYGFCHTTLFDPLQTSRPGVFVAGPFREPKDIPETVMEASGAAASVAQLLSESRHTMAIKQEYPPEIDVVGAQPRIGVFVCHCGSNIGGYLDVPGVAEYAKKLPGVIHAEDNLYTCSQDTIAHIIDQVKSLDLNRVVVSSCTPITHEPLFQDALRQAGLNPHLFEMANIRNQCSWVHSEDWDSATNKAKHLTRMAIAKAIKLEPLKVVEVPVNNTALIIGGGAAGMTAALTLGDQGFPVHLIEREVFLGGNLHNIRYFASDNGEAPPMNPDEYLKALVSDVEQHPLITVHLDTEYLDIGGFKGNFTSKLLHKNTQVEQSAEEFTLEHGVIIVTTGGEEYKGEEYGYGQNRRIFTQLEFEKYLAGDMEDVFPPSDSSDDHSKRPHLPNSVVMIQCVGPAEKYCSRICCTTALKNGIKLKELNPESDVTILYRDIRTYGFKERLYTKARDVGIRFIHFDFDHKPVVELPQEGSGSINSPHENITIHIDEPILKRKAELKAEILVLSTPIIPAKGTNELASRLKLSIDMDGFFLEAHAKLRPVDFSVDGVFMAGLAHYPKLLDETISQAQAAASRAAIILSQDTMWTNARVAHVDPEKCVGCLTCVRICPYDVPLISDDYIGAGEITGAAFIEPAICHGCGSCASECPAQAIQLLHYTDVQTISKVDALFKTISPDLIIPIEALDVKPID